MASRICVANASRDAVAKVNNITPSVIVLARVLGVSPVKFAEALYELDANDDFRAKTAEKAIAPAIVAEKAKAKAD